MGRLDDILRQIHRGGEEIREGELARIAKTGGITRTEAARRARMSEIARRIRVRGITPTVTPAVTPTVTPTPMTPLTQTQQIFETARTNLESISSKLKTFDVTYAQYPTQLNWTKYQAYYKKYYTPAYRRYEAARTVYSGVVKAAEKPIALAETYEEKKIEEQRAAAWTKLGTELRSMGLSNEALGIIKVNLRLLQNATDLTEGERQEKWERFIGQWNIGPYSRKLLHDIKNMSMGEYLALEQGNMTALRTGEVYDKKIGRTRPITAEEREGYELVLQVIQNEKSNLFWMIEARKHYDSGKYREEKAGVGTMGVVFKYTGVAAPIIGGKSASITWKRYIELREKWALQERAFTEAGLLQKIGFVMDTIGPANIFLLSIGAGVLLKGVITPVIGKIISKAIVPTAKTVAKIPIVSYPVLPAVKGAVWPISKIVGMAAIRPATVSKLIYAGIGGFEAYKAYQMYQAGASTEEIIERVGKDVAMIVAISLGLRIGMGAASNTVRVRMGEPRLVKHVARVETIGGKKIQVVQDTWRFSPGGKVHTIPRPLYETMLKNPNKIIEITVRRPTFNVDYSTITGAKIGNKIIGMTEAQHLFVWFPKGVTPNVGVTWQKFARVKITSQTAPYRTFDITKWLKGKVPGRADLVPQQVKRVTDSLVANKTIPPGNYTVNIEVSGNLVRIARTQQFFVPPEEIELVKQLIREGRTIVPGTSVKYVYNIPMSVVAPAEIPGMATFVMRTLEATKKGATMTRVIMRELGIGGGFVRATTKVPTGVEVGLFAPAKVAIPYLIPSVSPLAGAASVAGLLMGTAQTQAQILRSIQVLRQRLKSAPLQAQAQIQTQIQSLLQRQRVMSLQAQAQFQAQTQAQAQLQAQVQSQKQAQLQAQKQLQKQILMTMQGFPEKVMARVIVPPYIPDVTEYRRRAYLRWKRELEELRRRRYFPVGVPLLGAAAPGGAMDGLRMVFGIKTPSKSQNNRRKRR